MGIAYAKPLRRLIVASSLIGCFLLCVAILRLSIDSFYPLRFGVVINNKLYRADTTHLKAMERVLNKYNIKTVVELSGEDQKENGKKDIVKLFKDMGIDYYVFFMWGDGIATPEVYGEILETIDKSIENGKPVLVNCAAGVKRTGAIIALYRLLIQRYPPQLAYSELKDYTPRRFWDTKLINHLNSNLVAIAHNLHQRGVLHRVPTSLPVLRGE